MPHLGPMELVIILLIVVVLFGANRLPKIMGGLGEGIRNFKKSMRADETPPQERLEEGKPSEQRSSS